MWRVLNTFLIILIMGTIWTTYNIKHEVMDLQAEIRGIKRQIGDENAHIQMYQAEWSALTSAFNLNRLKQRLLPDYHPLTYKDMKSVREIPFKQPQQEQQGASF